MKNVMEDLKLAAVWVAVFVILTVTLSVAIVQTVKGIDTYHLNRERAEARRERVRARETVKQNQRTLDRIEQKHQAFCDETCRVTLMQPLMHEDIREDSDVAPEVVWRRVCRCLRVSPDGRFRSIERFTKNYNPLIDTLERR